MDELERNIEKSLKTFEETAKNAFSGGDPQGRGAREGNPNSNAIVAVIITIFFGPIGAFFCWWIFAKFGFLTSLIYALIFVIALAFCGFLCIFLIGYLLVPLCYIYMIYRVYQAVIAAPYP